MCPHMAGLLARYERSLYGRRGRHDGFLLFALAVSEAASRWGTSARAGRWPPACAST